MCVSVAFASDLISAAVVGSDDSATVSTGALCTAIIADSLTVIGDDSLTAVETNSAVGDVSAAIEDVSGEDSAGAIEGAASGVVVSMTEIFKA